MGDYKNISRNINDVSITTVKAPDSPYIAVNSLPFGTLIQGAYSQEPYIATDGGFVRLSNGVINTTGLNGVVLAKGTKVSVEVK